MYLFFKGMIEIRFIPNILRHKQSTTYIYSYHPIYQAPCYLLSLKLHALILKDHIEVRYFHHFMEKKVQIQSLLFAQVIRANKLYNGD